MRGPAHVASGYLITGLTASLFDINIFDHIPTMIFIGLFSLLPDIDHSKSLIGRIFYPISRYIMKHYSHRTITHSFMAVIVVYCLTSLISPRSGFLFTTAYISHLIVDMLTVQGVQFLYPFKKNACVMPSNPKYRFSSNNPNHEVMLFSACIVGMVFLKPLMKEGFWTSYNKTFSNYKHLMSEYRRSDDVLEVQLMTRTLAGEVDTIGGYLIYASSSEVMIKNDTITTHGIIEGNIIGLEFEHTGKSISEL